MIIGDSREYLYENILPKNSICAEIGVSGGLNSDRIIKISTPKKLFLIDMWDHSKYRDLPPYYSTKSYNDDKEKTYENVINKYKNNNNVKIIRKLSVDGSKDFDDNYFDWIYIDASHDYESVKEDCLAWWPKIKKDGYLCGHDYFNRSIAVPTGNIVVGVGRAVNEFIENNNLELYYKGNGTNDEISDWCILKV